MLLIRLLLICAAFGFLATAAGLVFYDIYLVFELDRILRRSPNAAASPEAGETPLPALPRPRRAIRVSMAAKFVIAAIVALFLGKTILVIPDGHAGVVISQMYGVLPETLYPGTHLIFPLFDRVQTYDIRDQVFSKAAAQSSKEKREVLTIDAKEGLSIGLGVTVRYRVDPKKLNYIQANVPQPMDAEVVEPVVTSIFREIGPNYVVREIFSSKREEFRQQAARLITARLAQDGIVVKEVLLGRVDLPEEYAQGLEGLLLKEQQDDQTDIEAEIEAKRVKIADSQAQEVLRAEVLRQRAQAVVAREASAAPGLQAAGLEVDVVVDDEQRLGRDLEEPRRLAGRAARLVHVRLGLQQRELRAVEADLPQRAVELRAPGPAVAPRELVEHEPARVVTRALVLAARVAEARDQQVQRRGLLAPTEEAHLFL